MRIIFFSVFLPQILLSNTLPYTIEDLIALKKSRKYREFLTHAHDIRPSKRDASWEKMLKYMATEFVTQASSEKSFDEETFNFIQHFSQWMEFKENVYFHTKREEYVFKYLTDCLKKQTFEQCRKKAENSWKIYTKNRDTGIRMAELLSNKNSKEDIFLFIKEAVKSDFGEFYCKKSFVQKAVLDKIYQGTLKVADIKNVARFVDTLIGAGCFVALAKTLLKELGASEHSARDFAYKILSAKKRLSQNQEDFYLARFLLDSPTQGRVFNLAWAKLKEISQDHKRRSILIEKLMKLDPLPDKLFLSNDQLKKKTLANYLYKTLPEFMDHYVKSCLEYLAGEGFYPNGNPTVNCDNFFKTTEKGPLPRQEIKMKYSGLKRFRYKNGQQASRPQQ